MATTLSNNTATLLGRFITSNLDTFFFEDQDSNKHYNSLVELTTLDSFKEINSGERDQTEFTNGAITVVLNHYSWQQDVASIYNNAIWDN